VRRRRAIAALGAGLAAAAAASPARDGGRIWPLAVGESLRAVVAAARDGDVIELEAGEHRAQAAVVTQGELTMRAAAGGTAVLLADGAHAEGKALLVVRGGHVQIEGLEFRGARVPAGNGAGIRFERGALSLRRCRFFDNEMGLLSSNEAEARLDIDGCHFGEAPRHEGALHHLLYVGRIAWLRVRGSDFSGGWRGHLLKSRAAEHHILCNRLVDGDGGEASYEIDLPNGGLARVAGNVIGQGPRPQNAALVAFGAEGRPHGRSHLLLTHNHLLNDAEAPAAFVRHWPERLPADATVRIAHNLFVGAALDGSWGQPEDGNRRLRHDERALALRAPPCPAEDGPVYAPAAASGSSSSTP
jgi:hypothetical protein